jgi:uncharacterized protein
MTRKQFIKRALLGGMGLLAADAFWFERHFIAERHHYLGGATAGGSGIKLVQLSDLHLRSIGRRHRQLAQRINEMAPDLVLITGDAVDQAGNLPLLTEFLQLLNPQMPKAAILGNWEYWGKVNLTQLRQVYEAQGTQLLVNATTQYRLRGKTLSVTGVDDYIGGRASIATALQAYAPADHHVVLNHCPAYSDAIAALCPADIPVDCILSGHTHGGQFNIFGYAPFLPQGSGGYIKGWYGVGRLRMYVCKGIGTSIIPARLGARAEMAVFHLGR